MSEARSTSTGLVGKIVKVVVFLFVAAVIVILGTYLAGDDHKEELQTTQELANRGFENIETQDVPQNYNRLLPFFDDSGTYAVKAGKCRFIVKVKDSLPEIVIENDILVISDVDVTKLRGVEQVASCF